MLFKLPPQEGSIQQGYLSETFVRPVCEALSRVWQDVNVNLKERSQRNSPRSSNAPSE